MIRFYQPVLGWGFVFVLLAWGLLIYQRRQRQHWLDQYAPLNARLLDGFRPGWRRWQERFWLIGLAFTVIALLGPQIGRKLVAVQRKGLDIIIVLDTSVSMQAEDVQPSRLARAKYETARFINQLQGDRIGLVAFAGTSFLQCPLTLDYSAAQLFLDAVSTGVIGTQGTALAEALQTALTAFKSREKQHKVIVVISDGEDHEGALNETVTQIVETGAVVYTVGIGSLTGAPIPLHLPGGQTDFKRDRQGRVVTTALSEEALRDLAARTGGRYFNLSSEREAFQKIYNEILSMEKKNLRSHEYSDFQHRYQIFLLIALALFIAEAVIPDKTTRQTQPGQPI